MNREFKLPDEHNWKDVNPVKVWTNIIINDEHFDVYRLDEYYHTFGCKFEDYYAVPSGIVPNYDTLTPFNGNPLCVTIHFEEFNYIKYKWNQKNVNTSGKGYLAINGEPILELTGDMQYNIHRAFADYINIIESLPIDFCNKNWKQNLIGTKVYYERQKAIISCVSNYGKITLKPEGDKYFEIPIYMENDTEYEKQCWREDYGEEMVTTILDKNILWHRD